MMKKLMGRRIVPRGPTKPKPITDDRKLISRKETARVLGVHPDTIKKLEDHRGGPLKVIKLHPNARCIFYRMADVNALIEARAIATTSETQAA